MERVANINDVYRLSEKDELFLSGLGLDAGEVFLCLMGFSLKSTSEWRLDGSHGWNAYRFVEGKWSVWTYYSMEHQWLPLPQTEDHRKALWAN